MKLIKDLGMMYANENSKAKRRYGLYECPVCKNEVKARSDSVKAGKIKKCMHCAKVLASSTHKLSNTNLYHVWQNIKSRCFNKNNIRFMHYGGRGITICDEWKNDFLSFYEWAIYNGYSDKLSIDRINNDGNYEPNNCRWTNIFVQNANTQLLMSTNTSGYRGVSYSGSHKKWLSSIKSCGVFIRIGYFANKEDAAKSYNDYVIDNNLPHTLNLL